MVGSAWQKNCGVRTDTIKKPLGALTQQKIRIICQQLGGTVH